MRIWKRLLGTALCLCTAVCLMSVSASAEEHSHPICGNITKCTNPDHSGGNHGGDVTWIEVTQGAVTDGKLTLENFRKLSPTERFNFSQKHPEEYKKLYDGGTK